MREVELLEHLQKSIGSGAVSSAPVQKRKISLTIEPAVLRKAVEVLLKHQPRFVIIAAVDAGMDVDLLYHFDVKGVVVVLKTTVVKEASEINTIVDLVPAAEWAEKEAAELFGVNFRAHPKPGRLLLPEGWPSDRPPLRGPFKRALPEQFCPVAESLVSTGVTGPMSPLMQRRREEKGLPPSPPASFSSDASLREVQELMRRTGFDEKAGYDWEKKRLRHK